MKFGLVGYPLGHSMSGFIHKELLAAYGDESSYQMIECPTLDRDCINRLKELDGFNVTIPYKNKIIPYLDLLDIKAQCFQSVNTVGVNQKTKGYNTDADGFLDNVVKLNKDLSGDILVLGAGGVARMVIYESVSRGARVFVAVRKKSLDKVEKLKKEIEEKLKNSQITIIDINNIKGHFDLVINCTPVGMYPDVDLSPVGEDVLKNCEAAIDLVYNPQNTKFLKLAKKLNKPCMGGMYMLVKQAAKAQEIWTDRAFGEYLLERIEDKANIFMRRNFQRANVAFVGFMASGKTTAAKALAKELGLEFIDMDEEIKKRLNMTIPEIFSQKGESFFREEEKRLINELFPKKDIVISTGGGAVMDEENRKLLRQSSIIVFMDTPFEICWERIKKEENRPLAEGAGREEIQELFQKRYEVYRQSADITIDGTGELEEQIKELSGYFLL